MPHHINKPVELTWWIAHNNEEPYQYGFVEPHQLLTTGMSQLESFTELSSFVDRMIELGIKVSDEEELDSLLNEGTISTEQRTSLLD